MNLCWRGYSWPADRKLVESVAAGEWREDVCFAEILVSAFKSACEFACRVIFVDRSDERLGAKMNHRACCIEQLDELIALRQSVPERPWLLEGYCRTGASSANLLVAVVSDFLNSADHGRNEERCQCCRGYGIANV